jgi:hypothetical protein
MELLGRDPAFSPAEICSEMPGELRALDCANIFSAAGRKNSCVNAINIMGDLFMAHMIVKTCRIDALVSPNASIA